MTTLIKRKLLGELSKFVKNLNEDDVDLSFFSGSGILKNLELNGTTLHSLLGLPTCLILSKIVVSEVSAEISWTSMRTVPLKIHLKGVNVEVELSNNLEKLQQERIKMEMQSASTTTSYGFTEKLVDGISVDVKNVKVVIKPNSKSVVESDPFPLASFYVHISRLDVYSTNRNWKIDELPKTIDTLPSKKEILTYKEIKANASITIKHDNSEDCFRFEFNPRIRITSKKRISDCKVLAVHTKFTIENIAWEVTSTQINLANNFFLSLTHLLISTGKLLHCKELEKDRKLGLDNKLPVRRSSSSASLKSLEDHVGGTDFNDDTITIEVTDLFIRLMDTVNGREQCVALFQIGGVIARFLPGREFNCTNDPWITALHPSSSLHESLMENMWSVTCENFMVLPVAHTENCHVDFLRLFSPDEKLPRPADIPLLKIHFSEYEVKPDSDIKYNAPCATLWVEVCPVEIVLHPKHWDSIVGVFENSLKPNPIAQSCKVDFAGIDIPKEEHSEDLNIDIKLTILSPRIVLPPIDNDSKTKGFFTIQCDRLCVENPRREAGDTMFLSDFTHGMFDDNSKLSKSSSSENELLFPHKKTDCSISSIISNMIKFSKNNEENSGKVLLKQNWKLIMDKIWIDFVDINHRENLFNVIKPIDYELHVTAVVTKKNEIKLQLFSNVKCIPEIFLCPVHLKSILEMVEDYMKVSNRIFEDREQVIVEEYENFEKDCKTGEPTLELLLLNNVKKIKVTLLGSTFVKHNQLAQNTETDREYALYLKEMDFNTNYENKFDSHQYLVTELQTVQISFEIYKNNIVAKMVVQKIESNFSKSLENENFDKENNSYLLNKPVLALRFDMGMDNKVNEKEITNNSLAKKALLSNSEFSQSADFLDSKNKNNNKDNKNNANVINKLIKNDNSITKCNSYDKLNQKKSLLNEKTNKAQLELVIINLKMEILQTQITNLTNFFEDVDFPSIYEENLAADSETTNKSATPPPLKINITIADSLFDIFDNSEKKKKPNDANKLKTNAEHGLQAVRRKSSPEVLAILDETENLLNDFINDVGESKPTNPNPSPNIFDKVNTSYSSNTESTNANSKISKNDEKEKRGFITRICLDGLKVWSDDLISWRLGNTPSQELRRLFANDLTQKKYENEDSEKKGAKRNSITENLLQKSYEESIIELQELLGKSKSEISILEKERDRFKKELRKRIDGSASARDASYINDLRKKIKSFESKQKENMREIQELREGNVELERKQRNFHQEHRRVVASLSAQKELVDEYEEEKKLGNEAKEKMADQFSSILEEKNKQIKKMEEKIAFYEEAFGK